VTNLEEIHIELKWAIVEAQRYYQGLVDTQRSTAPIFQAGNVVYILVKFIRTTQLSKKLTECYLGLFSVTAKVETYSYLIKLPEYLRAIHPVFYISQLELAPLAIFQTIVIYPYPLLG